MAHTKLCAQSAGSALENPPSASNQSAQVGRGGERRGHLEPRRRRIRRDQTRRRKQAAEQQATAMVMTALLSLLLEVGGAGGAEQSAIQAERLFDECLLVQAHRSSMHRSLDCPDGPWRRCSAVYIHVFFFLFRFHALCAWFACFAAPGDTAHSSSLPPSPFSFCCSAAADRAALCGRHGRG